MMLLCPWDRVLPCTAQVPTWTPSAVEMQMREQ